LPKAAAATKIAVLHGSGSRKAAEEVAWFPETAHIALGFALSSGQASV